MYYMTFSDTLMLYIIQDEHDIKEEYYNSNFEEAYDDCPNNYSSLAAVFLGDEDYNNTNRTLQRQK